mmetsp:Transcript_12391/g.22972  ORF Transcript_12391/g.22972 Transcript_12391/m.22972 type:complete len:173 (+) Transcript_12391:219-737(+)
MLHRLRNRAGRLRRERHTHAVKASEPVGDVPWCSGSEDEQFHFLGSTDEAKVYHDETTLYFFKEQIQEEKVFFVARSGDRQCLRLDLPTRPLHSEESTVEAKQHPSQENIDEIVQSKVPETKDEDIEEKNSKDGKQDEMQTDQEKFDAAKAKNSNFQPGVTDIRHDKAYFVM